jgi:exosortase
MKMRIPNIAAMRAPGAIKPKLLLFTAASLVLVLANGALFKSLARYSLSNEFASHALIIPFVSAFLLIRERDRIFSHSGNSVVPGGIIALAAVAVLILPGRTGAGLPAVDGLTVRTLAVVVLWLGLFLCFYGARSFREGLFPLLLLFFLVPIPGPLLDAIIASLQKGSAEASAVLFSLTGTPFFRTGTVFVLPHISVDIAPQCSGIRSSLALLITCMIGGHLTLKGPWHKLAFVLASLPIAMVKNAIRIVVLSLLAIHVDPQYLTGSELHRRGGVVFFVLALLIMAPILGLLRRLESKKAAAEGSDSAGTPIQ